MPLTAIAVRSLGLGKHKDGRGLFAFNRQLNNGSVSKTWTFRYTHQKREREMGLGSQRDVTLAQARIKADEARAALASGGDPMAPRDAPTDRTFHDDAIAYFHYRRNEWVPEHANNWLGNYNNHVHKRLGHVPTETLNARAIADCLKPIWETRATTARRLYYDIKAIIDLAIANDDEDKPRFMRPNPSPKVLVMLDRIKISQTPHPSIPWQEMPGIMAQLKALDIHGASALVLLLYCGSPRTSEILKMTWREIEGNVFHVPENRMKDHPDRSIPLTQPALDVLAKVTSPRTGFVWVGRPGRSGQYSGHIHDDAMREALRIVHDTATVHGLRSSFSSWVRANQTTLHDIDAREIGLGHFIGGRISRTYDREVLLNERRDLLERWCRFLG